MLLLGLAARAQASIFWSDNSDIGMATVAGTSPNWTWLAPGGDLGPYSVKTYGQYIYWVDETNTGSQIERAPLAGGTFTTLVTLPANALAIAVDAGHIYWSGYLDDTSIGRSNIDGSDVQPNFITGVDDPRGLAVDANYIYWTNYAEGYGTTIGRANIDGTGVNPAFISGAYAPWGVAVNATSIYWTNNTGGDFPGVVPSVGTANLDGSNPNQDLVNTGKTVSGNNDSAPTGIALDGKFFYVADPGATIDKYGDFIAGISRGTLTGSSFTPVFINFNANGGPGIDVYLNNVNVQHASSTAISCTPTTVAIPATTTCTATETDTETSDPSFPDRHRQLLDQLQRHVLRSGAELHAGRGHQPHVLLLGHVLAAGRRHPQPDRDLRQRGLRAEQRHDARDGHGRWP